MQAVAQHVAIVAAHAADVQALLATVALAGQLAGQAQLQEQLERLAQVVRQACFEDLVSLQRLDPCQGPAGLQAFAQGQGADAVDDGGRSRRA